MKGTAKRVLPRLASLRSSVVSTLLVSVLVAGLGFASSVLLNRWLGPTGRGELAAALVIPSLLVYLASMGMTSAVFYYGNPSRDGPRVVLATAIPIGLAQAATFGALAFMLLPLVLESKGASVIVSSQLVLLFLPASILLLYLQANFQTHMEFRPFNQLRLFLPITVLVGTVVLKAADELTSRTMAYVYASAPYLALLWALWVAGRRRHLASQPPSVAIAKQLFRFGAKAQIGELANSLNVRLDQVLIAVWLPTKDLGLYVAAVSATQLTGMVAFSLASVLQGTLTNEPNLSLRFGMLMTGLKRFTIVTGVLSAALLAVVPVAIPMLFGSEFQDAVPSAMVLVLASVALGYKTILASAATAFGEPWLNSRAELLGVAVTIAGLAITLPLFGIVGAAITSALAYSVQAWWTWTGLLRMRADAAPTPLTSERG